VNDDLTLLYLQREESFMCVIFPKSRRLSLSRSMLLVLAALVLAPLSAKAQFFGPEFFVITRAGENRSALANLESKFTQFGTRVVVTDERLITGLQRNERILGIDFRPATGALYGLGSTSRLYVIDTSTAQATQVGPQFPVALSGSSFGFDFNPTVDRIRIVSDTEQDFRVNPDTGAIVDSDLVAPGLQLDGNLSYGNGTNPNVAGSAYINNDNDPTTGTVLYNIDTVQDTLVTQGTTNGSVSPNSGQLFTVGSLNIRAQSPVGFDITTDFNGVNTAFAIFLRPANARLFGDSQLYTIDLQTGAATSFGPIYSRRRIEGLAISTPVFVR
jgi:hypothetical protein